MINLIKFWLLPRWQSILLSINVGQWFELLATRRCWANTKGTNDLLFLVYKWPYDYNLH